MKIDENGDISGFRLSVEEGWLDAHGRIATLALALENISDKELEFRFIGFRKYQAIRVWTPRGVLLAQSPIPPTNEPLPERGRSRRIMGSFKPGDKKVFIKVGFPELNKYVFEQSVLVQVYHYSPNGDYVLVSPPILLDPKEPHFIRSAEADPTPPPDAVEADKPTEETMADE